MSETTKPQTHTYDVLKKFNHKGVWVDPKDEEVQKNGLQLTEAQARFAVLNGILKRRSDQNVSKAGEPKSDSSSRSSGSKTSKPRS
ncbi:toxin-antitoxin system, antitoxin component, Xre family [Roseibium sp. TrichSKD4]|uniref:toxin-antitoxin system antitoxin component Xre family n=1 Tax=Roseibium sp. TrichSKD4 TaxID=744980 RepID=UPI0001E575FF|nr:toxin-antitoxin system antitoxin component Xre family [Roseibium sp. TrichSKD4]EFO30934.1 toxin-antitoxin system, antitoxin component, Xre family [Roseibium sp. TrichSKD4]